MKQIRFLILLSIALTTLFFSACGGGGGGDTQSNTDTTETAVLKYINASKTIIYEGDTVLLDAIVYNADSEKYAFQWYASEGSFSDPYQRNTAYIAPATTSDKYVNIYVRMVSSVTNTIQYSALSMNIKDGDATGGDGGGSSGNSSNSNSSNGSSGSSGSSSSTSSSGSSTGCTLGKGTYCTDGCLDTTISWKTSTDTIDTTGIYSDDLRIFATLHSPQNINDELTRVTIWWPFTVGETFSSNKAFPDLFLTNNSNQENAYVNYSTSLFGREFYFQYYDMSTGDVYCEKSTFPSTDFGFIPDTSTSP